jgi:SAM-dependent MidA family methyltransferase
LNELSQWIAKKIAAVGPVPFATYMDWALYHPEWGYYTSDRRKFGKEGDFYTSPSVNPVFAEVLADDIASKAQAMGEQEFTLIEFGAGEGRLARDILVRWQAEHPALHERVTYRIVETSAHLQEKQWEMLATQQGHVVWQTEAQLQAGAPYRGVVLTNELVDAYPVHRVKRERQGFVEVYIGWDATAQTFVEESGPLADDRIAAHLERYGKSIIVGQLVEVGLPGLDWYERTLGLLASGHVLTIDYGFDAGMLYHPSRPNGTLRGFYRHTLTDDPYLHVGEQDLTYDVNFTALREIGEAQGWQTAFYGSQSQFLLSSGILTRLTDAMGKDPFRDPDMKRNRAIKQMILPGGMGDHFKVLLQSKTLPVL